MGMHNAVLLLFKKAPPKIASAKIGVKFGGCGKILVNETIKKGKSITLPLLDPSLKSQKVESTNGRLNNMNKGGTNG